MNKLPATITAIESGDDISLIKLDVAGHSMSAVIIETAETASYLQLDNTVEVLFKETEVSIGLQVFDELSLRNRLPAKIIRVQTGEILSRITLQFDQFEIVSIITSGSAKRLRLKKGDQVVGYIKANEVMILANATSKNKGGPGGY